MRPDEEPTPSPDEDPKKAQENTDVTSAPPQPDAPQPPVVEPPQPEPTPQQPELTPEPLPPEPEPLSPEEPLVLHTPEPPPVEAAPVETEQQTAFDEQLFGEPEPPVVEEPAYEEPPPAYEPAFVQYADEPVYAADQEPHLFTTPEPEPYIPLPGEAFDRRRAREAQVNLDLDLARIKRRKRYGLFLTTLSVLFVALFVVPVTWSLVYLFIDAPSTITMMERTAGGQNIRHTPVPITRMSPYIIRSVIAAEDQNFCTHHGFDVEAIQKAMQSNADGGPRRGASTISQQTAKNLFLWQEGGWLRKGVETYFTSLIELMWPKRRIMEQYLNAAEWGDGIFGVEAAARARFGVSAADLTPLQAARLAAVLPSPNRWSATSPGPYVRGRAATIIGRAQAVRTQHLAGCVLSLDGAPSP